MAGYSTVHNNTTHNIIKSEEESQTGISVQGFNNSHMVMITIIHFSFFFKAVIVPMSSHVQCIQS